MRSLYSPITEHRLQNHMMKLMRHAHTRFGKLVRWWSLCDGKRIHHARELHNNYSEWAIANPLALSGGRLSSIIKLKYGTIKALSRVKYTLADPYMCISSNPASSRHLDVRRLIFVHDSVAYHLFFMLIFFVGKVFLARGLCVLWAIAGEK